MQNTAKKLGTNLKSANSANSVKLPVKLNNNDFNPLAISLSNPAESISAWVNGSPCYIATKNLPPFAKLPVVYGEKAQGRRAV